MIHNVTEKADNVEISVVMPCLNEEETIGVCITKAKTALEKLDMEGEIVVCDNGSHDRSVEIAQNLGARVVFEREKGYGITYRKGIREAKGKYIIIGDSDDTYNFSEIDRFIQPLMEGYDFIIGSRLKGKILPGAMSWTHRYVGNPFLSGILNLFFNANISDCHCGIRAFTKEAYKKMHLQTTGMEFASEMVINSVRANLKIKEIPITYHPRKGKSKLRSFPDAWRHLRFMLLYSPTYLFLVPGLVMFLVGLVFLLLLLKGPLVFSPTKEFDITAMTFFSALSILGFQIINIGFFAKIYSLSERFDTKDRLLLFLLKHFNLEKGILLGLSILFISVILAFPAFYNWFLSKPRPIFQIRLAIFTLTFIVIGAQIIFSSFFLSLLGIHKNEANKDSKE